MLTNLHIAVVGGDARQLEIIRKLLELGAKISIVGFDLLNTGYIGANQLKIDEIEFSSLHALILPVGGTSPTGEVATTFSNENVILKHDYLIQTPKNFVIYTGISNDYLDKVETDLNRKLIRIFDRDDIAIYNSIPTVEGTLMMAIQNTDFTIHGSKTIVLGLGRTGMSVTRAFHGLGAKVSVGVHRPEHLARAIEMGVEGFYTDNLVNEIHRADIVINTVPKQIITSQVISNMQSHSVIIDLASKPGGTDFRYAEKRGIKAILALSLPGLVAPKTAGGILANILVDLLKSEFVKGD